MAAPRSCSRCGIPGHTKRYCLLPQKEDEVFVRTVSDISPASRHVLSLRHKEQSYAWDKVQTYTTPDHQETKRVALDFAEAIKKNEPITDIFVPPVADSSLLQTSYHEKASDGVEVFEQHGIEEEDISVSTILPQKGVESSAMQSQETSNVTSVVPDAVVDTLIVESPSQVFLAPLKAEPKRKWFAYKKIKTEKSTRDTPRASWYTPQIRRMLAGGVAFVILLTVPLPARGYMERIKEKNNALVEESTSGFMALQSSTVAALGADIPKAGEDLTRALQAFESVEQQMQHGYGFMLDVGKWLPVVGKHIESRQNLLEAGQNIALGNTYILKGLQDITAQKESAFTVRLELLRTHVRSALPRYKEALARIGAIDKETLPEEYRETYTQATRLFALFVEDVDDVLSLCDALEKVLGNTTFKRYLVVFQNHHELRPTGGFVGSYAIVDVQKGMIKRIEVPKGGSYDVQGQFSKYLRPPTPLQLANGRFEFQDANWWPDFSISGRKLAEFYEASRQETIDGVIAVNATVLERVLSVLGPIQDDEFGVVMNEYDALETLQEQVESDAARKTKEPKAILSHMLDGLLQQLPSLGKADIVKLMTEFHSALSQKEIQLYFRDKEIEKTVRQFGWTGELAPVEPSEDYLFVVGANIQGQKSDAKVTQRISHTARIAENGTVEDTVTITRQHIGVNDGSLAGVPNIVYVRVYVPLGAELISANGFRYPPESAFKVPESWYQNDATVEENEATQHFDARSGTSIGEESGRTVFGNWMIVSPGDTTEASITYRLPRPLPVKSELVPHNRFEAMTNELFGKNPSLRVTYMLSVEKQSGVRSFFESHIVYPEEWNPFWRVHDEEMIVDGTLSYYTTLITGERVGAMFERPYEE